MLFFADYTNLNGYNKQRYHNEGPPVAFKKDGVWDWMTKYKRQNIAATMQATKPYIENTRECFGLLIITGALLINLLVSYQVY